MLSAREISERKANRFLNLPESRLWLSGCHKWHTIPGLVPASPALSLPFWEDLCKVSIGARPSGPMNVWRYCRQCHTFARILSPVSTTSERNANLWRAGISERKCRLKADLLPVPCDQQY